VEAAVYLHGWRDLALRERDEHTLLARTVFNIFLGFSL